MKSRSYGGGILRTHWDQMDRIFNQFGLEYFEAALNEQKRAVLAKGRKWRGP